MDSISLLEQHHSYFNENTSNEVKRIFLNKMYLNLTHKTMYNRTFYFNKK